MNTAIKAKINPSVLKWAREESGLTQEVLAKKIKSKPDQLVAWENGEDFPTMSQIRKIAENLKRTTAVFYFPKPPVSSKLLPDFRSFTGIDLSPQALLMIRLARFKRESSIELSDLLDEKPFAEFPLATLADNVEKIAKDFKKLIGFDPKKQFSFKKPEDFLKYCIGLLEKKDILIFQSERVEWSEFRGFSIAEIPFPVIEINSSDTPNGKLFTLFHEVGHILLRNSGICDFEEDNLTPDLLKTEVWCNLLSAEFLCPEVELKESFENFPNRSSLEEKIESLSKKFLVSKEVIARRLFQFGYCEQKDYIHFRKLFQKEFKDYLKSKKDSSGFAPYPKKVMNWNGRRFTSLVFDSMGNGILEPYKAAKYLRVNLKHLPDLKIEIQNQGQ